MAEIQIYDMATNATPNDDDFFEQDIVDLDLPAGRNNKKISLGAVSNFVAKTHNYASDLQTTNKTIVGAINEVLNEGTSVSVTNVLPATDTTKRVATITVDGVAKDVNADDADKILRAAFGEHTASGNPVSVDAFLGLEVVSECKVTMNPIQDLHGYSNPWVGGAGKNKLKIEIEEQTGITNIIDEDGNILGIKVNGTFTSSTITINATLSVVSGTEYTFNATGLVSGVTLGVRNNIPSAVNITSNSPSANFTPTANNVRIIMNLSDATINTEIYPMIRLSTVTDSTFAPYENICPISGRTETNILQGTNSTNMYKDTGVTPFNSNTTGVEFHGDNSLRVYAKTSNSYQTSKQLLSNYSTLENGKKYAIFANVEIKSGIGMIAIRNSANAVISEPVTRISASGTYMCIFTMSSEANFLSFFCTWDTPNIDADVKYTNIRFVEYEKLITKQFGQTVYDGRWNLTSGGLSGEWGYIASYNGETLPSIWISDRDVYAPNTTPTTGAEVVYKLATPTTIQTSAENISLLKGNNVVSTDGDSLELKYSADIKAYIDGKLA